MLSRENKCPGHLVQSIHFLFTDACWLAIGGDVLIPWRALFERSELARPPKARVRSKRWGQAGRPGFWLLLPKHKWLGCRDETWQHSIVIPAP